MQVLTVNRPVRRSKVSGELRPSFFESAGFMGRAAAEVRRRSGALGDASACQRTVAPGCRPSGPPIPTKVRRPHAAPSSRRWLHRSSSSRNHAVSAEGARPSGRRSVRSVWGGRIFGLASSASPASGRWYAWARFGTGVAGGRSCGVNAALRANPLHGSGLGRAPRNETRASGSNPKPLVRSGGSSRSHRRCGSGAATGFVTA